METKPATHDLDDILELIGKGKVIVTKLSDTGAKNLGYSGRRDAIRVVKRLRRKHFYKTMEAESEFHSGEWQDVYKITDNENRIYIKLQMRSDRGVVVQFKEDTSSYRE